MKIVKVTVIVIGSIAGIVLLLTLTNLSLTAIEKRSYRAPGTLVDVNGGKIHVFTEGHSKHNVVLLSGLGTSSPVTDFAPLIKVLAPDFRVSVVECFGYGWSDWTRKPRTNRNIVEEVRLSLLKAQVHPPYIVIPHSMSGIYALYWAAIYPKEIRAIVALDTSVPAQIRYIHKKGFSPIYGVARTIGIVRAALLIDPGLVGYESPAYSEEQRSNLRRMASWNFMNRNVLDEAYRAYDNLSEVSQYKFPDSVPLSIVLSKETIEYWSKTIPVMDWVKSHEDLVTGNRRAKVQIVEGGHNVHWRNSETIAEIVRKTDEE